MQISEAIRLLQAGYVLESRDDNGKITLIQEDKSILIYASSYNLKLSVSDFLDIYKNHSFALIKDDEADNKIDELKDKEYYSKLQKSQ